MKNLTGKLPLLAGSLMMAGSLFLAHPALAASTAPKVDSVKYENSKKVEVEFKGKVQYNNPTVTVTDSKGNPYATTIVEADDDDFTFRLPVPRKG